jgi:hypothetical protein
MTITANTFLNVNVGLAPNDGLGDPLRTAFIKLNDNFNYITDFIWPNIQITRLTTDITSTYISTFNLLQSDVIESSVVGNTTTNFIGNTLSVNNFTVNSIVSNVVEANVLSGVLGNIQPNPAFITTLAVSESTTTNNLIVNNSITATNIDLSSAGNIISGNASFSNINLTGTLQGESTAILANVRWVQHYVRNPYSAIDLAELDFFLESTSTQIRLFTIGNSTSFVTNITYENPTISPGLERKIIFKNNASSLATRYIVLPNNFNNLKTANITVSNTGTAFMHFIPLDETTANLYVFIANT